MRLIDADALADALYEKRKNYPQWVADVIGNMPVIDAIALLKEQGQTELCDRCGRVRLKSKRMVNRNDKAENPDCTDCRPEDPYECQLCRMR